MSDLKVAGGSVFLDGQGFVEADLLISDGRIAEIVAPGSGDARETISAKGLAVLPGGCDPHLHLGHGSDISRPRAPGDAASESAAAALGGVTSFIPYAMSPDPHDLDDLCAVTQAGSRIDFGFHFVIATEAQLSQVADYAARGVPTAKLFMNLRGDEGARLGLPAVDDGFLLRLLEALREAGGMLCPHPENIELAWVLRDRVMAENPSGTLADWNATRPSFVEAEAIQRAGFLGRIVGTPVYFVHTSSQEALKAALEQRQQGSQITIETCVHYLTDDVSTGLGPVGKVNPPLRMPADRNALWDAIRRGEIDTVGTDHVHRPASSKDGDIWKAQPGFPGLDTFLPALFTEGARRGVPLDKLVPLVTSGPCDAMGLSPGKGRIKVGADADLTILDMAHPWTVTRDRLATDAGYSIHEGREMTCRVEHTLVRGRFVVRNAALVPGMEGTGRFLPRTLDRKRAP